MGAAGRAALLTAATELLPRPELASDEGGCNFSAQSAANASEQKNHRLTATGWWPSHLHLWPFECVINRELPAGEKTLRSSRGIHPPDSYLLEVVTQVRNPSGLREVFTVVVEYIRTYSKCGQFTQNPSLHPKKPVTKMATKICVVLTSSMVSIAEQRHQIDKTRQILNGNRILYREVDCSLEENRSERDRYFEASNVRGNYPQVFLQNEDGSGIVYIGSFNEIEELNEASDIPPEILSANNIATLSSVFADVARRQ